MNKLLLTLFVISILIINFSLASAVIVKSVKTDTFSPGKDGIIRIEVENILEDDVKDVSLRLDFTGLPFTPVGSSEEGTDELGDGKEEDFTFRIKAANDITPGDYQIPYILRFREQGETQTTERFGSIGVTVTAITELSFSVSGETPVVGREGKITLKIINKGFSDAKFVLVKVFPEGYTLLSESQVYIGSVDSDDFETATFDVIFNKEDAKIIAIVEYKDFNNKKVIENINFPLNVYSEERAIELRIIKKNNTPLYITVVVTLILFWILWRTIRKRIRIKKSMEKR